MSTFNCPIVKVKSINKHVNADSLSVTEVDGTPVIFKSGALNEGDLAVYCPLDAVVPTDRKEFAFLAKDGKTTHRLKAIRLRGLYSEGLLLPLKECPALEGKGVGFDAAPVLGIVKYEEPEAASKHLNGKCGATSGSVNQLEKDLKWAPHYNIEALAKNRFELPEGTPVEISEKLHGTQFRAVSSKGKFFVGSHNVWRRAMYARPGGKMTSTPSLLARIWEKLAPMFGVEFENEPVNDCVWWSTAKRLKLAKKLRSFPGMVIYGEVFGNVQDLKYGLSESTDFRMFAAYDSGQCRWLDPAEVRLLGLVLEVKYVPVLYSGPYSKDLDVLRTGNSTLDEKTIREGFVVKKLFGEGQKAHFKFVSEAYKLRKGGTELH